MFEEEAVSINSCLDELGTAQVRGQRPGTLFNLSCDLISTWTENCVHVTFERTGRGARR